MKPLRLTHNNSRLAAFWAILGALGTLAGFPYITALLPASAPPPPLPLPLLAILGAIQAGLLLFLLSWVGLRLGRSLGLDTPFARAFVYRLNQPKPSRTALCIALISGIVGGGLVLALAVLFQPFLPETTVSVTLNIALWKRLLAVFYGGITEELLLRLFLMTLLTWILWQSGFKTKNQPSNAAFWLAIVLSAVLFGIAHLPAAAAVWSLTSLVIARTLVLNSLLGIAFGYLYWQWGLEYAMLSHFCAGLVVHGLGGS